MKRFFALMMVLVLALTAAAFAEEEVVEVEYTSDLGFSFSHFPGEVEITTDEAGNVTVALTAENALASMYFTVSKIEGADATETLTELAAESGAELTTGNILFAEQKEWVGYEFDYTENDVSCYCGVYGINNSTGAWVVTVVSYYGAEEELGDAFAEIVSTLTFED